MAALLLKESCTVTVVHSKTRNIEQVCQQADIVVAAVGKANMVNASYLKADAVVIDVGINRIMTHEKHAWWVMSILKMPCRWSVRLPLCLVV